MISAHVFAAAIVALMPDLIQVTFSHHITPHHRALSTLTLSLAHDLRVQLGGRHFLRLSGSSRSVGLPGVSRAASGRRHGAAAACTHPRLAAGNTLSGAAAAVVFVAGLIFCLFAFRSCQARLLLRLLCPVTVPWDPVRAGTGRRSGAVRWPTPQVKPVVWFCANHVPFSRMEGLRRAHSPFSHRIITVSHLVQEWIELPWDLRIISVNIVFQLALGERCQVGGLLPFTCAANVRKGEKYIPQGQREVFWVEGRRHRT
jgi:hypothetical protein